MTAALDFAPSKPATEAWADVERSIAKAALSSGVRRVSDLAIRPEELSDSRVRSVWAAVLRLIERGSRGVWLDGQLVAEVATELPIDKARQAVDWVKGAADEADDAGVDAMVQRVRDRIMCASVYAKASLLRAAAEAGTTESAKGATRIIAELRDLSEGRYAPGAGVKFQSAVDAFDEFVRDAKSERVSGRMAKIGLAGVDRWMRMDAGTATVVGAASHVGKTGIIASASLATAQAGLGAYVLTLEDPWKEIVARQAAEVGRLNPEDVRSDQPTLDLEERIAKARLGLVGLPIMGVRIETADIDSILAGIRSAASKGAFLVCIDFLQRIRRPKWAGKLDTRRDWFDECMNLVLATGAERGVHLLLGSQVTRDKTRKQVTKDDLRESSSIGESARNVITLQKSERGNGVRLLLDKAKGTRGAGKSWELLRDDFGTLFEAGTQSEW